MNIVINNSNDKPIYEQIKDQLKEKIISGELKASDALPSMRLLAKELRISVITTKRAYEELEREGFIITVTGKGSFVAEKNLDLIREESLKKIEDMLNKAVSLSQPLGLKLDDMIEMLTLLYDGD